MRVKTRIINTTGGFTLIEVLVSIVIFSVAILGFAASTMSVIRDNQASHFVSVASALAQDKLEELKSNPATLASGGPITDTLSGETFSRSWTVTNNSPITGMHKID